MPSGMNGGPGASLLPLAEPKPSCNTCGILAFLLLPRCHQDPSGSAGVISSIFCSFQMSFREYCTGRPPGDGGGSASHPGQSEAALLQEALRALP